MLTISICPSPQQSDSENSAWLQSAADQRAAGREERIFNLELHVSSHFLLVTMGVIV